MRLTKHIPFAVEESSTHSISAIFSGSLVCIIPRPPGPGNPFTFFPRRRVSFLGKLSSSDRSLSFKANHISRCGERASIFRIFSSLFSPLFWVVRLTEHPRAGPTDKGEDVKVDDTNRKRSFPLESERIYCFFFSRVGSPPIPFPSVSRRNPLPMCTEPPTID